MKKSIFILSLTAIMLACFPACQREALVAEEKPGDELKEVNAQFVFNVATNAIQTKQTSAAVQSAGTPFRGLEQTLLLAYTQDADGQLLTTAGQAQKAFSLSNLLGESSGSELNSRRILPIMLPLGTNTLLFYGRSPEIVSGEYEGFKAYDAYGKLDHYPATNADDPSADSFYFQLGKRLSDEATFAATQKLLAGILTAVMSTGVNAGTAINVDGISLTQATAVSWATYGAVTNGLSPVQTTVDMMPVEQILSRLYKNMVTKNANELRAGSGEAILGMVLDLWKSIQTILRVEASTDAEAVAKYLAQQIDLRLKKYFTISEDEGIKDWASFGFQPLATALTNFLADIPDVLPTANRLTTTGDTNDKKYLDESTFSLADFPGCFNLMPGATFMTFTTTSGNVGYFSFPDSYQSAGMLGGVAYKPTDFYYPTPLLYYGNSPVRVSDTEFTVDGYPTTANWNDNSKWNGWAPNSHVVTTTQSVAMQYNIRYGVSLLATKVKYASNNIVLQDNNQAVGTGESDINIAIADGKCLKFTGIVIGGQPLKVDWNFLPVGTDRGFIYDTAIKQTLPTNGDPTTEVYTTVFDNWKSGGAQDKVYVALEFQNCTGVDFFGKYNMVRNGSYFYLIGELSPTVAAANDIDWDNVAESRFIPNKGTTRVFVQDFKTAVTFKLGPNALKEAYLSVPDLRTTSMTVGLSVDIEWQTGINYGEITIGGSN